MVYKRAAIKSFVAGFSDALWPGAFIYVVTSPLIRKRFAQCCILNGVIFLGSICILNYIIIPTFVLILQFSGVSSSRTEWAEFAVDKLYKAIWVLPLYLFSFVVNSLWYQDIAQQAHLLHSNSRNEEEKSMKKLLHLQRVEKHKSLKKNNDSFSFSSPTLQPEMIKNNIRSANNGLYQFNHSDSKLNRRFKKSKNGKHSKNNIINSIRKTLNEEIYHSLFLVVFNVEILLFSKMGTIFSLIASSFKYNFISILFDYIGLLIAFFLFCWQHSFLSFEYKWIMEGKPLKQRIKYFEERIPYFSGFGAPLTIMVLIAPQIIATGIYALTFPLFIIQAIESYPVCVTQHNESSVRVPFRIPVFATTKWIEYVIIWFFGNHFCCVRCVLLCVQKCGRLFGI